VRGFRPYRLLRRGTRHGRESACSRDAARRLIVAVAPRRAQGSRQLQSRQEAGVDARHPLPLNLEFYIGLPPAIPDERLATVKTLSIGRALWALPRTPPAMLRKYFQLRSTIRKSFLFSDLSWNDRRTSSGVAGRQLSGHGMAPEVRFGSSPRASVHQAPATHSCSPIRTRTSDTPT
jgi:hypothetical protein